MSCRRARAPKDKAARRALILATAGRLFDDRAGCGGVTDLTMAALARQAGLAKGTLYLYFHTKEEIFLALVLDELRGWIADLHRALDALDAPTAAATPEAVARAIAESLASRTRLLRLLGVLHPILERNLSPGVLVAFKLQLQDLLSEPAARLEAHLAVLSPGDGARFVLRLHAIVVGLALASRPPPTVAEILDREDLAGMRVDFATELEAIVAALLRGWM